jgi:serine/threonine protein kinase
MVSTQMSQVHFSHVQHSLMQPSGGLASRIAPPPALMLHRGQRFAGRFEIHGLLDHGGMGSVYLADDTLTGERVCLKLIRPEFTDTPEAVAGFMQEGKLARRLSHPNIGRVFDIDSKGGICFITMEYANGMNLRRWLNRRADQSRAVRLADVLWVARRLLGALDYMHKRGVLHRDIKPENIVIAAGEDGRDKDLKLVDFGLACQLRASAHSRDATQRVGTWGYMAPEVYHGCEADARSDLYGVAVVLFEMLTGQMYVGDWTPMQYLGDTVPHAFQNALRSALSPQPGMRPQTAIMMLKQLEFGALQPVPTADGMYTTRMVPLSRTVIGTVIHVLISAVLLFAAFAIMSARTEQKIQRMQREFSAEQSQRARAERNQQELRDRIIELEAAQRSQPAATEQK